MSQFGTGNAEFTLSASNGERVGVRCRKHFKLIGGRKRTSDSWLGYSATSRPAPKLFADASLHNWVMANQRMAAALKAKGYAYRYVFAEATGHTDGRVTRQTLPGALEWLRQGYPVK